MINTTLKWNVQHVREMAKRELRKYVHEWHMIETGSEEGQNVIYEMVGLFKSRVKGPGEWSAIPFDQDGDECEHMAVVAAKRKLTQKDENKIVALMLVIQQEGSVEEDAEDLESSITSFLDLAKKAGLIKGDSWIIPCHVTCKVSKDKKGEDK